MWKFFHPKKNSNEGIVSVFSLLLLTLLASMGMSLVELYSAAVKDSSANEQKAQSELLAESALDEVRLYLKSNPGWSGMSQEQAVEWGGKPLGTYDYTVIKKAANIFDVTAKGYVPSRGVFRAVSHTLSQRLRIPSPYQLFNDGFETGSLLLWQGQQNDTGITWGLSTLTPRQGTYHARAYKTETGNNARVARLLTSPLDLSEYDLVVLRFSYRMKLGKGTSFQVQQSNDGGVNWVQIYSDSSSTTKSSYIVPSVKLCISPVTNNMQFRFDAHITDANEEWYLDAVELSTPFVAYDIGLDS